MRAFVTGGTGLIGRHVVDALLAGGWEVWALVRDPARAADLAARGVRIVPGDVTRPDFVHDLAGVDVLFHHAAWFEVGVRDYQAMYDVNVAGTVNVLSLARQENVPRIVVTSTAGLFPSSRARPATGTAAPSPHPDDPHAVTKLPTHEGAVKAMHSRDLVDRRSQDNTEIIASSPEQFAAFINAELARWSKVIREAGLGAE